MKWRLLKEKCRNEWFLVNFFQTLFYHITHLFAITVSDRNNETKSLKQEVTNETKQNIFLVFKQMLKFKTR